MKVRVSTTSILALAMLSLALLPLTASAKPKAPPIPPGKYRCKVGKMYKLRHCEVRLEKDRAVFEMGRGNLIAFRGEVTREGRQILVHARLIDERPFGCYHCQPRCSKPGSCVCTELPKEASNHCLSQRVNVVLNRVGEGWSGWMTYTTYWNIYHKGKAIGWETKGQIFPVVVRR